mgnify:CR=1 FL=1
MKRTFQPNNRKRHKKVDLTWTNESAFESSGREARFVDLKRGSGEVPAPGGFT